MTKSKILQDLVHLIVSEQTKRKGSDAGIQYKLFHKSSSKSNTEENHYQKKQSFISIYSTKSMLNFKFYLPMFFPLTIS
jgi:hypothetical protein